MFISSFLKQLLGVRVMCRYSPSCSEYAKIMIGRYGILKGGAMAFKRILSCQPFANSKLKVQS